MVVVAIHYPGTHNQPTTYPIHQKWRDIVMLLMWMAQPEQRQMRTRTNRGAPVVDWATVSLFVSHHHRRCCCSCWYCEWTSGHTRVQFEFANCLSGVYLYPATVVSLYPRENYYLWTDERTATHTGKTRDWHHDQPGVLLWTDDSVHPRVHCTVHSGYQSSYAECCWCWMLNAAAAAAQPFIHVHAAECDLWRQQRWRWHEMKLIRIEW